MSGRARHAWVPPGAPWGNQGRWLHTGWPAGLSGHGVGRGIHEKPSVPNYYTHRAKDRLDEGLVITLEPFLTPGTGRIFTADDGWTIKTVDGKGFAQFEHTVIITKDKPILVTAV